MDSLICFYDQCPYNHFAAICIHFGNTTQQPSSKLPTVWRDVAPNGYHYKAGNATTTQIKLSLDALGWTAAEALETHLRLRTFAQDWDYPGMEAYDDL